MSPRKLALILGFLVLLPFAVAQSDQKAPSPKNEIGLLLGGAKTSELTVTGQNRKVSFGTGLTFQANYARRLTGTSGVAVYLEVPFLAAPLVDISSEVAEVPANYASLFVTPSLRLQVAPNGGFSPWLSVGGGYARFDSSKELQDGSPNPSRIAANKGAIQFGGGADFRVPVKLIVPFKLRLELRDIVSGKANYNADTGGGRQHNLVFSGGFVVSF
jgi:opacity protein-like surface antigen